MSGVDITGIRPGAETTGGGGGGGDASAANQTTIISELNSVDATLLAGLGLATLTKTTIGDDVAVASATSFHGISVRNTPATDAVLLTLRDGNSAAATPFDTIAIAAGQSINWFLGRRAADGKPITGGAGLFMTDESTGAATVATNLTGHVVTGVV